MKRNLLIAVALAVFALLLMSSIRDSWASADTNRTALQAAAGSAVAPAKGIPPQRACIDPSGTGSCATPTATPSTTYCGTPPPDSGTDAVQGICLPTATPTRTPTPTPVVCGSVTQQITAGVNDWLSTANGPEPASPSAAALQYYANLQANSSLTGFDEHGLNHYFIHTFTSFGGTGSICGATLHLTLRPNGDLSWNDNIALGFITPSTLSNWGVWGRFFGKGNGEPGLFNRTWSGDYFAYLTFDLAALPQANGSTLSILNQLNQYRALDIQIQDDTAVDYMTLTLKYQ